MLEVDEINDTS